MWYRIFCIVALGIVLAPNSANAEPLSAGRSSLTFQINEDFRLSQFDGAVFAMKKHFSPRSAIRFQVGGGVSSTERTIESGPNEIEENIDGLSFRFDTQYLRYSSIGNSVSAFFGGGPFFSMSSQDREEVLSNEDDEDTREADNDSWALGARLLVGAEYFPTQSLGIHAEYGIAARSMSSESRNKDSIGNISTSESDTFSFGGDQFLFGLSVYF